MATETEQIVIPLQDLVPVASLQSPPFAASPIRSNYVESENRQRNGNYPISSEELAATALPPVDRGFKAWSFIAAAFVLEILVWGLGFSYGVFQEYYISHKTFGNASEAAIGAVGTTTLAIGYFECLVIILVAQHWPDKIRGLMWSSLALCCSSLALASFATQVKSTLVTDDTVLLLNSSIKMDIATVLARYPSSRCNCANVYSPTIAGYSRESGRWCWLHSSYTPAALVVLTKPPVPFSGRSSTVFIQALAYFPVSLYMSVYTASLGLPPSNGTLVLAVFNLSSVIGQIVFGHLCDIAPYSYVMIGSGVGAALSAYLLWGFAHSLQLIFAFVVIFGSLSGGFASIFPAASVQIAGSEDTVSNVMGCLSAIKGIAAVVGPLVAAALHRPHESSVKSAYSGYGFTQVTLFVGSMMVATAVGGLASRLTAIRSWRMN
ncbi:hypothetical protein FRC09_008017 [Ceratobasidium sp. 395]|nr:hypothetical protein FRC09_008017 [Ceratobasidium sp. 395]